MADAPAHPPLALVTGAGRGIGLAITRRLAQDGLRVMATDVDADLVATEAGRLRAEGLDVQAVGLDVRDRPAVAALFERLGNVQVAVNNAGRASRLLPIRALDATALQDMLSVNVLGTFIVAQEAVRRMQPGGRIINIASRGYLGGAGAAHYVASKAAVVGLTRAMAVELRWAGITVNAVAPGMVDTRMLDDFTPAMRRNLESREPAGAAAHPGTIADAVAFLASVHAAQINGQVLLVDGGKSVGMPPL